MSRHPSRTCSTCGRCVRGILCARCNMIIGAVEAAERDVGLDKIRDYLDTARLG